MSMDDIDTGERAAKAAPAADETEAVEADAHLPEYDVEFTHARRSGVDSVRAANKADACAKLILNLRKEYPGSEDAIILTVEPG